MRSLLVFIILGILAPGVVATENESRFPNEEQWSEECAVVVADTPRLGPGIKSPQVLERYEPIDDLKKWGLKCSEVFPVFEIVIDSTGNMGCARILNLSKGRPPKGLYAAAHRSLPRWKFRPATRDGHATAVLVTLTINYKCA